MKISKIPALIIPNNMDRRMGTFVFSRELMSDYKNSRRLMKDVVVIKAWNDFANDLTYYTAMHPSFEYVPQGYKIPEYTATVFNEHGMIKDIKWTKVEIEGVPMNILKTLEDHYGLVEK